MTITSIIGGMQLFDVPATLTNGTGDPNKAVLTTAMYLYNQGFKSFQLRICICHVDGTVPNYCCAQRLCATGHAQKRGYLRWLEKTFDKRQNTQSRLLSGTAKIVMYLFLIALVLLSIVPFYLVMVNATHSSFDIVTRLNLLPGASTLENYATMQSHVNILAGAFLNQFRASRYPTLLSQDISAHLLPLDWQIPL